MNDDEQTVSIDMPVCDACDRDIDPEDMHGRFCTSCVEEGDDAEAALT